MSSPGIGSSFEGFLDEVGIRDEVHDLALKRVLAWQLEQERARLGLSKSEMAERMGTSRSQLDRLLDPTNDKVQLDTLAKAARAVGRRLKVELV